MPFNDSSNVQYSPFVGFVFLFNLIVGAGALAIPQAFGQVGVLYGSITILLLAFTSYISATFVVEAIGGVTILSKFESDNKDLLDPEGQIVDTEVDQEDIPLLDDFSQTASKEIIPPNQMNMSSFFSKFEMSSMAEYLFGKLGKYSFYACIVLYLFGDLAIYAVAIPKSLGEVTCGKARVNNTGLRNCIGPLSNNDVYHVYLVLFALIIGPFACGNVQKTKSIQILTTFLRHSSFAMMIIITLIGILNGHGRNAREVINQKDASMLPNFFGGCIYSFMCHHSIPSLVTPIQNKRSIGVVLGLSYLVVLIVYLVLCYTAVFRFQPQDIKDVYTLNFTNYHIEFISYFLSLFPVFTLSSNFPLIAITLRENLKILLKRERTTPTSELVRVKSGLQSKKSGSYLYGIMAIAPPFLIALFTQNVSVLVGVTGSYAGLGIQWIIPSCLVYKVRQRLKLLNKTENHTQIIKNPYRSVFSSDFWIYFIFLFAFISLIVITITRMMS